MAAATLRTTSAVRIARNLSGCSPQPLLPTCAPSHSPKQPLWRYMLVCMLALISLLGLRSLITSTSPVGDSSGSVEEHTFPSLRVVPSTNIVSNNALELNRAVAEGSTTQSSQQGRPTLDRQAIQAVERAQKKTQQQQQQTPSLAKQPTQKPVPTPTPETLRVIPDASSKASIQQSAQPATSESMGMQGKPAPTEIISEKVTATGTACKDEHEQCRVWAKIGECWKNELFMHRECRKSCGQCPRSSGAQKEDVETAAIVNDPSERLKELRKTRMAADPDPTLPCFDNSPDCAHWETLGECDKNPGFMMRECRVACLVCDAVNVAASTSAADAAAADVSGSTDPAAAVSTAAAATAAPTVPSTATVHDEA